MRPHLPAALCALLLAAQAVAQPSVPFLGTAGSGGLTPSGDASQTTVTATGAPSAVTSADRARVGLGLLDFGADPFGIVDAGSAATAALTAAGASGASVQVRVPPAGTYTFGSSVNSAGRAPTWIIGQDANLNAYNLVGPSGGWAIRPRRALGWTYGTFEQATVQAIIGNPSNDAPPQVLGFTNPSQAATYTTRDSVALYTQNTSPPILASVLSDAVYTPTTIAFAASEVSSSLLKVGMFIQTSHSPFYTGQITAWSTSGATTTLTVNGWFQVGNTAAGQVPPSGTGASINPITSVWANNSVVSLFPNSFGNAAIGFENDVQNNKTAYIHNENPALQSPLTWGYFANSIGTYGAGAGFLSTGNFYYGMQSRGALGSGFAVTTSGVQNPTYGYTYNVTAGTAFNATDPSTGNSYFSVLGPSGNMKIGQGTNTSVNIDMFGSNSAARDARLVAASGLLSLRSNATQISDGVGNIGLQVSMPANAADFWTFTPAATGGTPTLNVSSSVDSNISYNILTKGTGTANFSSGNGTQFSILDGGASTVNHATVQGSAAGSSVKDSAAGTDTNINRVVSGKGLGLVCIAVVSDCGNEALRIIPATSQAVAVRISGAASGSAAVVSSSAALTVAASGTNILTLGSLGASGSPVVLAGAMIDGSGVRQTLTGTGYTVPANTSLVRFVQTGTIATQTVTLPTALADGQPIQFVNYAGMITALTFSPAVVGWTNGSTLAANTGLRIRWDTTAAAWQREQ